MNNLLSVARKRARPSSLVATHFSGDEAL